MDGLYLFLILLFAALMLGLIAACARLAPVPKPKVVSKSGEAT